jgi:hypothetical protein
MPKFTRSKLVQKDDQFLIWEYRGLRVVLDRKRVVPDDPGQDTPALVHYKCAKYKACSTYWCACGEGELLIESPRYLSGGVHKLSENQLEWLESLDPELTEFLYKTNPKVA